MLVSREAALPDVFSLDEIALAAGVSASRARELAEQRAFPTFGVPGSSYVALFDATAAVRTLKGNDPSGIQPRRERPLFSRHSGVRRSAGLPILFSSATHAVVILSTLMLTAVGLTPASPDRDELIPEKTPLRLVFVATPGPGGGGGGGGLKQRTPPPKAERKGPARLSSPLPERKPPEPIVAVQKPPEPKPEILKAEPLPRVVAPVATSPADTRDRPGVLQETTAKADSRGPGEGGGVGSGTGTGLGEGDGAGIGPGSGGGTGGGPYRPGSGISPPRLLREVKPDYTEEARQRNLEGEVVLEIVVRRDGSVGDIRLVNGLGHGLNERAIAAVRQWRFAPAQRRGSPVDVLVEVAVEFRLR